MTKRDYFIKRNISPNIDSLEEILSDWLGNDEFTYNHVLRGIKSKNNICTYEAYEKETVVGLITAWKSDFHPYCTYFSIALKPRFNFEVEAMLLEALSKTPGILFPLQTSIWETSYRLKSFYEANDFIEIRRTYMPILKSSKVDKNNVFTDVIAQNLSIKDVNSIKNNELLKFKLINLVRENYISVHSINPVGQHDLHKWEKLIFNDETNLKGSYIALKDNEILAYSLLHFSETPNMFEFGWRGTRDDTGLRIMLMLTVFQVNFAAENGADFIEAEVDTTDPFALEMLKFFPFSPAPTLLTFQKSF